MINSRTFFNRESLCMPGSLRMPISKIGVSLRIEEHKMAHTNKRHFKKEQTYNPIGSFERRKLRLHNRLTVCPSPNAITSSSAVLPSCE